MEKAQVLYLAQGRIFIATCIPTFVLGVYFLFTYDVLRIGTTYENTLWIIAGYVVLVVLIVCALFLTFDIQYDNQFLYIKKLTSTKHWLLNDIQSIEVSNPQRTVEVMGFRSLEHDISIFLEDEKGNKETLYFSLSASSIYLKNFIDLVKEIKPDIELR